MTVSEIYSHPAFSPKVKCFYNKQEGTVWGRNLQSWSKIGIFYVIFYSGLAALVLMCSWVFLQTLDPRIPKCQLNGSAIGVSPGLGFRPMPIDDNIESTLIWLTGSKKQNYEKWKKNLMNNTLDKYYTPGKAEKGTSIRRCTYLTPPKTGEVCDFDVRLWGDCSVDRHFNYHLNKPCIFLKLNRIFGWVPDFYNDTNDLPPNMPKQLQEHIRSVRRTDLNTVWISCAGENPADVEYLGPIKYYPDIQGFPGFYYPYRNDEGYLSPLVAVQFLQPTSGIVMNIECRAWAKNIKHSRREKMGLVHFELLID